MRKEALLVIDVDSGDGWGDDFNIYEEKRQNVGYSIKRIIEDERKRGGLVVFIVLDYNCHTRQRVQKSIEDIHPAHLAESNGCTACEPSTIHLAPFLAHKHDNLFEPIFVKRHGDAFYCTELGDFLVSKGITHVNLIGCNTFQCVQQTAYGALLKGFHVTLLRDGTYPPFYDERDEIRWRSYLTGFSQTPQEILTVSIR